MYYVLLAGIGHGFCFIITINVAQFYFQKKLGFVNGIVHAGSGVGLLVLTPIIERLCAEYGWQGALLIHSAILANFLVCGALFRPSGLERERCLLSTGHPRTLRFAKKMLPRMLTQDIPRVFKSARV